MIGRRASSCFTREAVWERLRGVVPTRLASPALEHVSVRNLATLAWMRLTTKVPVSLTTHPQASFPPRVAPEQLPSPRALPIGGITWSAILLQAPNLAQRTRNKIRRCGSSKAASR